MIGLLGEVGGGRGLAPLIALLGRDEPEPVTAEVLRALGRFPAPSVADAVLGRYPRMSAALKERSADLLVSRKEWATRLLEALGPEFRRQPASRIRRILELEDPELTRRVEAAWGRLRPTSSAEKAEAARRLAGVIGPPEQFDKPGRVYDRSRGRRIFQERCAKCHTLFGEGKSIGPDLTGAERRNIETLTLSIVDPSAAIRREYAAYRLDLDDGRSLTGLILDPTPESYTLLDDKGERTVIARRDVRETREAQVSLMPDGLLDGLDTQALTDLFSYLTAKSP
jgi:putative heme-binding domain-containing protein